MLLMLVFSLPARAGFETSAGRSTAMKLTKEILLRSHLAAYSRGQLTCGLRNPHTCGVLLHHSKIVAYQGMSKLESAGTGYHMATPRVNDIIIHLEIFGTLGKSLQIAKEGALFGRTGLLCVYCHPHKPLVSKGSIF